MEAFSWKYKCLKYVDQGKIFFLFHFIFYLYKVMDVP